MTSLIARWFLAAFAAVGTSALAAPPMILPHAAAQADAGPPGARSRGRPVRFNAAEIHALPPGDDVELTLPNGKRHVFASELVLSHGDGVTSWIGSHRERGSHYRAIVTSGPGGSFGRLATPDGTFHLVPGAGHDWLLELAAEEALQPPINLGHDALDPGPVPKGFAEASARPEIFVPVAGVNALPVAKAAPSPNYVVDIMFVYTQGLADTLGANLMTRLHHLVTVANTAYASSEVAITLRLVNATRVAYTDADDDEVALRAITPAQAGFNAALFGQIETIRSNAGADIVAFLRNGDGFGGSGIAWVGTLPLQANRMYSVTTGCVLGCESVFIHEVGHNMGNMHDRATASFQAGGTASPPQGAYSYGYGHAFCKSSALSCNPQVPGGNGGCTVLPECSLSDPSNFVDIMGYFFNSGNQVLKFSNPLVTCISPRAGNDGIARPCGSSVSGATADTAQSMNNNRMALSALRGTSATTPVQPTAGSLQFSATGYAATEGAGVITFAVTRIGGTSGSVSVNYATADGTARAGLDYTAASGSLTWDHGSNAIRLIDVPIANDGVAENVEAFTMTLSSPTGSQGVYLGHPVMAGGIIHAPWPPNGVTPPGFITTSTPSYTWTVAASPTLDGTASLQSGQPLGTNNYDFVHSDLVTQAQVYDAGHVTFAYQVSSYPGYGLFELLVDGALAYSDTDTTGVGWKYAAVPIASGSHTLVWRYKNSLPFACSSANPPPPAGALCANRMWLDAVALPLQLATTLASLSGPSPATAGQPATFTATLSIAAPGTPTGTMRFSINGTSIAGCEAVALTGETANCTTTLAAGTYNLAAQYAGNASYYPALSPPLFVQAIAPAPPRIDLDLGNDGRADVLWRDATGGLVYLWAMDGLAIASQGFLPSVPTPWAVAGMGDTDGDARADVVWRHPGTGENYLWRMDGFAIASQGFLPAVPPPWSITGIGDTDGDGRADVVWRNAETGQNYLWKLNGLALIGQGYFPDVPGPDWQMAAVRDFDGDGRADVLWRNTATGQNYLWLLDGLLLKAQGFLPSVPVGWEVAATPDADGNGRADLFWRETATGLNYLWLVDGLAIAAQGYLPSVAGTAWKPLGRGDYDGNGRGDILWRNDATGEMYGWLLQGIAVAAQGFLPTVPGANWSPAR